LPDKPLGNKSLNLHIRLTERDAEVLHAACAHIGQTVSTYVRWLINEGAKQTLAGPSKSDRLKEFERHFHGLLPPVQPLPPPRPSPYDPSQPPPDIKPAPMFIPEPPEPKAVSPQTQKLVADVVGLLKERPDASQPLFGPPKGLDTSRPVVTAPEPAESPSGATYLTLDDLIRASTPKPGTSGPQPMMLPDDMDDWV
jgi:hypothetical protein